MKIFHFLAISIFLLSSFSINGQNQGVNILAPSSNEVKLQLLPSSSINNNSVLFFGEGPTDIFGMFLKYNGVENALSFFGKDNQTVTDYHLKIHRNSGDAYFGGNIILNPERKISLTSDQSVVNLVIDPSNLTSGVLKSRVTVDEIKLASSEGQIRTESDLDVFAFSMENATLRILPTTTNSGDSATVYLAENRQGTVGMGWTYDGQDNEMELFGKSTFGTFGPHLRIHRDSGNAHIGDGSRWHFYDQNGENTITIDPKYTPPFPPPFNTPRGRISTSELEITGGSDVVEFFSSNEIIDIPLPGELVSISADGSGEIITSSIAYDPNVVGVVSGANGVLPGLMLGQKGNAKVNGNIPIAIGGRAYIAVSETSQSISPGDRITTSTDPGKCMKAENFYPGTSVGKALTFVEKGFVLVLINIQ